MKKIYKILLSIPSLFGLFYMVTYVYPSSFKWIYQLEQDYSIDSIQKVLTFVPVIILIVRIWKFKNVKKDVKYTWTWLLFFFNLITAVIYVWFFDDKLVEINKENNRTENYENN